MLTMNLSEKDNNGSADHHEDNSTSETIIIINCAVNPPLMLLTIMGNAMILAAIIRTPSIRSPSMIMLCSLAVSDLLVGFITQPLHLANQLTKENVPFVSHLLVTMGHSVCGVSLLTMTAISVDRFLALHCHMRYVTLVTKSRVKYILVVIWLISFCVAGLFFWKNHVHSLLLSVGTAKCLVISTFSYIKMYQIVRRHQLQIRAQQQAVQRSNSENNNQVMELKKSAMNTFMFYIVLLICYFPAYIVVTLQGVTRKTLPPEWICFASICVFMSSSINPFLYCWRLRELRTAVVKTARKILRKN